MVKSIMNITIGTDHELDKNKFVSPTFNPQDGTCMEYNLLNLVRTGLSKILRTDISDALQEMWEQLVSKHRHSMLTFVFPKMDPFCPAAFSLVKDVYKVLE